MPYGMNATWENKSSCHSRILKTKILYRRDNFKPMNNRNEEKYVEMECGHCKNNVHMKAIVKECSVTLESTHHGDGYHSHLEAYYDLLLCPACKEVTLRKHLWDDLLQPEIEYTILYPQKSSPASDLDIDLSYLPPQVARAYRAALSVKEIDANAYGTLLRRTLEAICIEQDTVIGNNLHKSLGQLSSKGRLPSHLFNIARHLKDFGNFGAHTFMGELTESEIPVLDKLCQITLEYLYHLPLLDRSAQQALSDLENKNAAEEN